MLWLVVGGVGEREDVGGRCGRRLRLILLHRLVVDVRNEIDCVGRCHLKLTQLRHRVVVLVDEFVYVLLRSARRLRRFQVTHSNFFKRAVRDEVRQYRALLERTETRQKPLLAIDGRFHFRFEQSSEVFKENKVENISAQNFNDFHLL